MKSIKNLLADRPIRYNLFPSYSSGFVATILLGRLVIPSFMRSTTGSNSENELKISTTTIPNMVSTSAAVSAKSHRRAEFEKNMEIVQYCYNQYNQGLMSKEEATCRAAVLLLS